MSDDAQRAQFLADLARMVDGESDALEQHGETLSNDPDAEATLEQARSMAAHVSGAGDDFRPDPQLSSQLAKVLADEPRATAAPPRPAAGDGSADRSQPEDAEVVDEYDDDDDEQDGPKAPRLSDFPGAARRFEKPKGAKAKVEEARVVPAGRSRLVWIGVGVAVVAAGGIAASMLSEPPPPPPEPVVKAPPPPKNSLTLHLRAVRGAEGGKLKLSASGGGGATPLERGAKAVVGQTVKADPRTRGMFSLGKKVGRLILGGDSALQVDPDREGHLSLLRGHALIDAQGSQQTVLTLNTPAGPIALADALVHVRVRGEGVDLDVLRGSAQAGEKKPAQLGAGQSGWLVKGKPAQVATVWGMSPALDFAQFGDVVAPASPPPGLPELSWQLDAPEEPDTPTALVDGGLVDAGPKEEAPELPRLAEYAVEVEIQGHTARTTVIHTFRAPSRNGVANYRVPLPADATWTDVSAVANEAWLPAEPVADGKGKAVHAQNAASAGVLQIDGLAVTAGKPVLLRFQYEQVLRPTATGRLYALPLPHAGDGEPHHFKLSARAGDGRTLKARAYEAKFDAKEGLRFDDEAFVPDGDFAVEVLRSGEQTALSVWSHVDDSEDDSIDSPGYVAMSLRPELPPAKDGAAQTPLAILVDSSQSMAGGGLGRANAIVAALLDSLHPTHPVQLIACDRSCRLDAEAPATAGKLRAKAAPAWVTRAEAAGASDLSAVLARAQTLVDGAAKADAKAGLSLVYIGDGAPTLGELDDTLLTAAAAKLHNSGRATLSTVGLGHGAGSARLAELARAGGGHHVQLDGQSNTTAAARELLLSLGRPRWSDLDITLPEGVEGELPKTLPPITDGEEITLLARLSARAISGELIVLGNVWGQPLRRVYKVEFEAAPDAGSRFVSDLYKHGTRATHGRTGPPPATPTTRTLGGVRAVVLQPPAPTIATKGASVMDTRRVSMERLEQELASLSEATDKAAPENEGRTPRAKRRSWLVDHTGPYEALLRSVDDTRAAAESEDGSERDRDEHARALTRLGNLERTRKFVDGWRVRHPRSALALLHKGELLMQLGRPDDALRVLEGIVDLRPADRGAHARLAGAYERSGRKREACAHTRAAARLGQDAAAYLAALHCLEATAQDDAAERFRKEIGGSEVGAKVVALEAEAAKKTATDKEAAADKEGASERVHMEVTWEPKQDLDVSIVSLDGETLSWIGGRPGLVVAGARSKGGERLEFDPLPGIYKVMVTRPAGSKGGGEPDEESAPAKGELMVDLPDGRQRTKFELTGARRAITRIVIMPAQDR